MALREETEAEICAMELFADSGRDAILQLVGRLEERRLEPGEALMRQGEESQFFALVVEGELRVTREAPEGGFESALGPAAVVGELAMLTGQPRTATVAAGTATTVLTGAAPEFAGLLALPGVQPRLQSVVRSRLAENLTAIGTRLPGGKDVLLHPLRISDRERFIEAYQNLSLRSRSFRFFSGAMPPPSLIEYLLNVDHVNHFAWLVVDAAQPEVELAEARYVRFGDRPDTADIALTVTDAFQGRGIGTLLMGALGAAAIAAGVSLFSADTRSDNAPMLALMMRAGAEMRPAEAGVVNGVFPVEGAARMIDESLRVQLQRAASDLVAAAGLQPPEGA